MYRTAGSTVAIEPMLKEHVRRKIKRRLDIAVGTFYRFFFELHSSNITRLQLGCNFVTTSEREFHVLPFKPSLFRYNLAESLLQLRHNGVSLTATFASLPWRWPKVMAAGVKMAAGQKREREGEKEKRQACLKL
jgi:hypothetical protein